MEHDCIFREVLDKLGGDIELIPAWLRGEIRLSNNTIPVTLIKTDKLTRKPKK